MSFTMMAMITLVVIAIVVVAVVVHEAHSRRIEKKRQAAVEYLTSITRRLYFYGQPVSKCLEEGVVLKLEQEGMGDFARPMGYLILYALELKGNNAAHLHWQECYDREANRGYYSVRVRFAHGGCYWAYNVCSHGLDEPSFTRWKGPVDPNFADYRYWDLPRRERHLAENCTDPGRSDLHPDFRYRELDAREYEQEVEHLVGLFCGVNTADVTEITM